MNKERKIRDTSTTLVQQPYISKTAGCPWLLCQYSEERQKEHKDHELFDMENFEPGKFPIREMEVRKK